MAKGKISLYKSKQGVLLKAAMFNLKNFSVLGIGVVTGMIFSPILIPLGVVAYGILCYLDLSSEEFVKKVLSTNAETAKSALESEQQPMPPVSPFKAKELQKLHDDISATKQKIKHLYEGVDQFTQQLLGDFAQIEDLVARGGNLLLKAQHIRDYLTSENIGQIKQDVASLQDKVRGARDDFSKQQYQQALDARYRQLKTFQDMQQVYERLVSQVTNVSISLESMFSKMMKLKTAEDSLASIESEQVSEQLKGLLRDVDQLDGALNENLSLPN